MKQIPHHVYVLFLVICIVNVPALSAAQVLLHEEFNTLDNWEPFYFEKIKEHSTYTIEDGVLKAESHASASALRYNAQFNVYDYPRLAWRWKVGNVLEKGDATQKSGDDYPIRLYVVFAYDPKKANFSKRLKYNTAKAVYGEYPPHASLNYIWANQEHAEDILTNTYAAEAKMILLQKGRSNVGTWQAQQVNILDDYRRAFGEDPPATASLVIMSDTDNTKEQAVAYVDDIRIFRE